VALRLYDTLSRTVRPFAPLEPGRVGVYLCGPTVQAPPHVGHLRSAVAFDILRRWLTASGYEVVFARNVTDIDDKILTVATETGRPWWAVAEHHTRLFDEAYGKVGVRPPTVAPRATGHIPEMVTLIERLVSAGHAYPAGGDVYFDVRSFAGYGRLSGQKIDAMAVTERSPAKRDPLDFALWKGAKPGEPSWRTPWGPGRPGWHLECSAMATRYLGSSFDLHGGGLDLLFPHHENELAQSAAAGDGFARFWLHNGLVSAGSAKLSKSLGNAEPVGETLRLFRPVALRYALGAAHYRSEIAWSEDVVADADAAYRRIESFVGHAVERLGGSAVDHPGSNGAAGPAATWADFAAAMDDDLAVPRALGVLHGAVRDGNTALDGGDDAAAGGLLGVVRRMLDVLGLDPVQQWPTDGAGRYQQAVDALVGVLLEARAAARDRRDFAEADRLRGALQRAGVTVEDRPDGTRWRLS
jgi:cysteinyl-tRNA synthetase